MNACWCGSRRSEPFGPDYQRCLDCETLIYAGSFSFEGCQVNDDDRDFYGKSYWLERQDGQLGYPDFESRTREDLSERNLFWLQALSRYKAPPSQILELGCAHGSFVSLLKLAGYEAEGLEMSPWVVEYGSNTFGVQIHQGPIECTHIPEASLDAIVMMDVIEHLPNPKGTLSHCLGLLKPDGILLIQTPGFRSEMEFDALKQEEAAFLEQLKPGEHLFMFSRRSIKSFFDSIGAIHSEFLPAIFSHYDMFLAVGKEKLTSIDKSEFESALSRSSSGRIVQAMLDLYCRESALLQLLQTQEKNLKEAENRLIESETDRAARLDAINRLIPALKSSEADREDRFQQIQQLTELAKAQAKDLNAFRHWVGILLRRPGLRTVGKTIGLPEIDRLLDLIGKDDV